MSGTITYRSYYGQLTKIDPERLIVRLLEKKTATGTTGCPHCGATGRHVQYFLCADGVKRGAMAGCMRKFVVHHDAQEIANWENKLKKYPGWRKAIQNIEYHEANLRRAGLLMDGAA